MKFYGVTLKLFMKSGLERTYEISFKGGIDTKEANEFANVFYNSDKMKIPVNDRKVIVVNRSDIELVEFDFLSVEE